MLDNIIALRGLLLPRYVFDDVDVQHHATRCLQISRWQRQKKKTNLSMHQTDFCHFSSLQVYTVCWKY